MLLMLLLLWPCDQRLLWGKFWEKEMDEDECQEEYWLCHRHKEYNQPVCHMRNDTASFQQIHHKDSSQPTKKRTDVNCLGGRETFSYFGCFNDVAGDKKVYLFPHQHASAIVVHSQVTRKFGRLEFGVICLIVVVVLCSSGLECESTPIGVADGASRTLWKNESLLSTQPSTLTRTEQSEIPEFPRSQWFLVAVEKSAEQLEALDTLRLVASETKWGDSRASTFHWTLQRFEKETKGKESFRVTISKEGMNERTSKISFIPVSIEAVKSIKEMTEEIQRDRMNASDDDDHLILSYTDGHSSEVHGGHRHVSDSTFRVPNFVQAIFSIFVSALLLTLTLIIITQVKRWCRSKFSRPDMRKCSMSLQPVSVTPSTGIPESQKMMPNPQAGSCPTTPPPPKIVLSPTTSNGSTDVVIEPSTPSSPPKPEQLKIPTRSLIMRRPSGPFSEERIAYAGETYKLKSNKPGFNSQKSKSEERKSIRIKGAHNV